MNRTITCVLADIPWKYDDRLRMDPTIARSAEDQYDTMTVDEAKRFFAPYRSYVADTALLFLWVTNPFLLDGSGSDVCRAWGFTPKQLITWVKGRPRHDAPTPTYDHSPDDTPLTPCDTCAELERLHNQLVLRLGLGHFTRGVTEHMILGTRGTAKSLIYNRSIPNYLETHYAFVAPLGRHLEKPDESYQLIERLTPGPYMELFSRKRRDGWLQFGNELPAEYVAANPALPFGS